MRLRDVETALWVRERDFWTSGEDYYRRHLAGDVLMAFPGLVLDREAAIAAVAAAPRWKTPAFDQQRCIALSDDVVALHYHATARRDGEASPYRALVTSVYVRQDDEWRLAIHQHTPYATANAGLPAEHDV